MRVLIVCEYATLNGGENSMLSVLPLLPSSEFEIIVAAPGDGDLAAELRAQQIPLETFGTDPTGQRADRDTKIRQLDQIIARLKPQIVHANSLSMSRLVGGMQMKKSAGVQTVGHIRDILNLSKKAVADVARNDRLIAVSSAVKNHFVTSGIPATIIQVIHNGVDLDRFHPRPKTKSIHHELGISPAARLILFVGQLGMRKGIDDVLKTFSLIAPDVPDIHLLVVGERHSDKHEAIEFEAELHAMTRQTGLQDRVHFLGRRHDVPRLMNESEVLVHLPHQEPLGRVLIEAAASGCCVLTTDVGGSSEIFPKTDFDDVFVPDASPDAAAAALLRLLRDDELREQRATAMADRMAKSFSREQSARKIANVYRTVCPS